MIELIGIHKAACATGLRTLGAGDFEVPRRVSGCSMCVRSQGHALVLRP
jgi:hypothetical protein